MMGGDGTLQRNGVLSIVIRVLDAYQYRGVCALTHSIELRRRAAETDYRSLCEAAKKKIITGRDVRDHDTPAAKFTGMTCNEKKGVKKITPTILNILIYWILLFGRAWANYCAPVDKDGGYRGSIPNLPSHMQHRYPRLEFSKRTIYRVLHVV